MRKNPMATTRKKESTDIIVSAESLRAFFTPTSNEGEENAIRERHLRHIPVSCNYEYNPATLVTELCTFHPAKRSLAFHLQLKLCAGSEIRLTQAYYSRLKNLCNTQSQPSGYNKRLPPSRPVDKGYTLVHLLLALRLV